MPQITTYAIKTGRRFTAVTVDQLRNQCTVPLAKPSGGARHLFVSGIGRTSIVTAANDGVGESFPTLKALMTEYPNAERAMDYDA